jgi:hypothetical protein
MFDVIVVAISVFDNILSLSQDGSSQASGLNVMRTFRVVRLTRVMRVFRLMRFFRSLRVLIAAILNTVKNCVWVSMVLGMILYVCGILFTEAAKRQIKEWDEDPDMIKTLVQLDVHQYFSTLPRSIFTCFKSTLGGIDWEIASYALSELGVGYVLVFVLFIVFVYLAVLNVISGLFIQSSIREAESDLENMIAEKKHDKDKLITRLKAIFAHMDDEGSEELTMEMVESCMNHPDMQNLLMAMEVEASDAWTLLKLLDADGNGQINCEEFVMGCLQLRGPAKSIHIAELQTECKWLRDQMVQLMKLCAHNFVEFRHNFRDLANAGGLQIATKKGDMSRDPSEGACPN